MLTTEVVLNFDKSILNDVVFIRRHSFHAGWEDGDDEEYYGKILKNGNNISIFLKDKEKSVGYILAIPQNDAVTELKNDDKFMHEDSLRYYIELVAILPEYRGKQGFSIMLATLERELKKKGILNISLHARVSNSFNKIVGEKIKVTLVRRIDKWRYYNYEEPTDYIEGAFL